MRRPQFSLKTMLWLMALVAAFFAGSQYGRRRQIDEIRARFHHQYLKVPEEVEPPP